MKNTTHASKCFSVIQSLSRKLPIRHIPPPTRPPSHKKGRKEKHDSCNQVVRSLSRKLPIRQITHPPNLRKEERKNMTHASKLFGHCQEHCRYDKSLPPPPVRKKEKKKQDSCKQAVRSLSRKFPNKSPTMMCLAQKKKKKKNADSTNPFHPPQPHPATPEK